MKSQWISSLLAVPAHACALAMEGDICSPAQSCSFTTHTSRYLPCDGEFWEQLGLCPTALPRAGISSRQCPLCPAIPLRSGRCLMDAQLHIPALRELPGALPRQAEFMAVFSAVLLICTFDSNCVLGDGSYGAATF